MRLPALVVLSVAGWFSLALPASAQPLVGSVACSLATLSAGTTYGYAVSGFYNPNPTTPIPIANAGVFTSNGAGSFTGSATVSVGGGIASGNFRATYTLGTNCTGVAIFSDAVGDTTHLAFTVDANGGVIDFVQTDIDFNVSGTAQPVAVSCDVTAFSGPYTYAISGWVIVDGVSVPYADSGRIVANGAGGATGKSTFSSGGLVYRRTLTGTYSITAGCTGVVNVSDNLGNVGTVAMILVNNGQQALFVDTTPTHVVTGHIYRGQNTCSNSNVSGSYVYSVSGFGVAPGVLVPFAYSGTLSSNGSGNLTGSDYIANENGNGVVVPRTYSATYTINSDCSGNEVVKDSLGDTGYVDFFITDQGGQVEFIQTAGPTAANGTNSGLVVSGQGQQMPSGSCTLATVNGTYGYAVQGWLFPPTYPALGAESAAGQFTTDGAGHLSGAETVAAFLQIVPEGLNGTYTVNPDCTGTTTLTDSQGVAGHFHFVVTPDGRQIFSIETDGDTAIAGYSQYQQSQAGAAVVNAGSFTTNVSPGSLVSIFGSGLATAVAQAPSGGTSWPTTLGNTTVRVNGTPIPIYYVNPTQINAQLPVNLATGSAQLTVTLGSATSSTVNFTVEPAAPGIFTYGLLRAIATYPNSSVINSPSVPAQPGDLLQVYLTGGGNAKPVSGTWTTGSLAPPVEAPVTSNYSVTLGGVPVTVEYLGLTPGSIGLYQLNFTVPALPAGDQTLTITVNGQASTSAVISVSQ